MGKLKTVLRESALAPLYLWLAGIYRQFLLLFIYPATARIGRTDYDSYWDEKFAAQAGSMSVWRLRRAQAFESIVNGGDEVLDVGTGDGALLKYLIDRRSIVGRGLDISPKAVAFCQSQGLNVELADVKQPVSTYIKQPVDYIILSEIIEHLPDPELLLNDLRSHARKGLIVSIPNTGFVRHRIRLLMGKFPLQWVVSPGEHLRFWTLADFRWWARQLDFEIVREIGYEGVPWLKTWMPGLFSAAFVYHLSNRSNRPQ